MKRLLNISRCMAAILGVVAILSACTPEPIHHRGRGDWPDDNTPGREGGEKGGNSGTYQLDYGYANFYGHYYPTKPATDNYLLTLYSGDTYYDEKEDAYLFKSSGVILTLDILTYDGSDLSIEDGKYNCTDDGGAFTFIPTYRSYNAETDEYNDYDGSSLYVQKDKKNFGFYKIKDGSLSIKKKVTGYYEIEAEIVSEYGENKFSFYGMLDIYDDSQGGDEPGGDEPGENPSFPGPEGSEWAARALFQKHLDDNKTDEYTLFLSLGDYAADSDDFKTSGSEIAIELFTTKGAGNSIASGTYKCISSDPEPFTFFDGYYWTDDDGNPVLDPSYFYRQYSAKAGDYSLESITSGNLIVEKVGSEYKLSFKYGCGSGSYAINYIGAVDFYEAPDLTKAAGPKAAYRTSAVGREIPAVRRKVGTNRLER